MLLVSMLFVMPVVVDAQTYGSGTYGSGAYNEGETAPAPSGGGGGGSGGGGGGSGGQQLTPTQLHPLVNGLPISEGCGAGHIFNIFTGTACPRVTQQKVQGCAPGYRFSTSTGAVCPADSQSTAHTGPPASSYIFTRDLQLGVSHFQVQTLQEYLNNHGHPVSSSGPGSLGNETIFFGERTRAALIKFQKAVGIKPAAGYFGPITRRFITTGQ